MTDAWEIYYDDFRRRAARVPEQQYERSAAYAEAAHDAYERTANHLTREVGWDDDRTLTVMRGLTAATRRWIERDEGAWDDLRERLQTAWTDLTASETSPPLPRSAAREPKP